MTGKPLKRPEWTGRVVSGPHRGMVLRHLADRFDEIGIEGARYVLAGTAVDGSLSYRLEPTVT